MTGKDTGSAGGNKSITDTINEWVDKILRALRIRK